MTDEHMVANNKAAARGAQGRGASRAAVQAANAQQLRKSNRNQKVTSNRSAHCMEPNTQQDAACTGLLKFKVASSACYCGHQLPTFLSLGSDMRGFVH